MPSAEVALRLALGYLSRLFSPENLPTIGLLVAGVVGVRVALKTLTAMRESSERQLRAYVVVEAADIVNIADPPPAIGPPRDTPARLAYSEWGPIAGVRVKNAGQTPAFKQTHWGNICVREYPLKSELPPKDPESRLMPNLLGPGIMSPKTLFHHACLTQKQVADLRAGTAAIYVYGEIHYTDAFEKRHFTRYRLMHHVLAGAIGVSTTLSVTEEGNDGN